jgi:hypothetical protein
MPDTIQKTYNVGKACVLQAVARAKLPLWGKCSAKDVHEHIWKTKGLEEYKQYDQVAIFEKLYKDKLDLTPTIGKTTLDDLEQGRYLCVLGDVDDDDAHIFFVDISGKKKSKTIKPDQDPKNKLTVKDSTEITRYYKLP